MKLFKALPSAAIVLTGTVVLVTMLLEGDIATHDVWAMFAVIGVWLHLAWAIGKD